MEKEKIHSIANSFLNYPYTEQYLKQFKNSPYKFFTSLRKLDEVQINQILSDKPSFSNTYTDGLHSLHYACLLGNIRIIDLFMQTANKNGLKMLPTTQKTKKLFKDVTIRKNTNLLNFCAAIDNPKSYARIISYMKNPEKIDFEQSLYFALAYNSPKVIPIIKKIIGEYTSQKIMLNCFNLNWESQITSNDFNLYVKLKEHFNFNPEKFQEYGIDVNFNLLNKKNYFTATLDSFGKNIYNIQTEPDGANKLKQCIEFFIDKGFNLDTPDGEGTKPRDYFNEIIKKLNPNIDFYKELKKHIPEIEKKSLLLKEKENNSEI